MSSHVSIIVVKSFKSDTMLLERGMTIEECRKMFISCKIPIRLKIGTGNVAESQLQEL